ncbi:MAG: response regulator [Magnetococcales bacterium]|nr:response regulator [Magnetococcales bacterium]
MAPDETVRTTIPIKVLLGAKPDPLRHRVREILQQHGLTVVSDCGEGAELLSRMTRPRCHVVLVGTDMAGLDGFEVTRRLIHRRPFPVVMFQSEGGSAAVRAAMAGAVGLLTLPDSPIRPDLPRREAAFARGVRVMAGVARPSPLPGKVWAGCTESREARGVVGIGVSTGGPAALKRLLEVLPEDFPWPVVVVQHIHTGFLEGLVAFLTRHCRLVCRVPEEGERILPGFVYFAPDGHHLEIRDKRFHLTLGAPVDGLRPAVAPLFASLLPEYGERMVAVLLTGMGRDGALEMKRLHDAGVVTLAQDAESCAVYGMPAEAVRLGAVDLSLPPEGIGNWLVKQVPR